MSSQICVVSVMIGELSYKKDAIVNHQRYCDKNGYTYICIISSKLPYHPMWLKPYVILHQFTKGFEYVFWNDGDSFFLNPEKRLENFALYNKDIVVSGDENDIANTGHIFFKNSEWSIEFVKKWAAFNRPLLPETMHLFKSITTHFIEEGFNDQPPFNILLAGADETNETDWYNFFNEVNMYPGNPEAKHQSKHFAPHIFSNVERANTLVHDSLKPHVQIVSQSEMNSYPWTYTKGDFILHCVGDKLAYKKYQIKVENTNEVLKLAKQVATEQKLVVFTNANSWYIDTLIKNLVRSAAIYEPNYNIAVFCSDQKAVEKCKMHGIPYFARVIVPFLNTDHLESETSGDTIGYTYLTFIKIALMKLILEAGFTCLYIDPDMAFKCSGTIDDIQKYLFVPRHITLAGNENHINSNLMIASSCDEAVELFTCYEHDVEEIVNNPTLYSDEDYLAPLLKSGKYTYSFFHEAVYPNGLNADSPFARMLHANCVSGLDKKINLLKLNGGWYLNESVISSKFMVSSELIYPPFQEGELFEEYFYKYINSNKPILTRKYIGASWTSLYCNAFFKGIQYESENLQKELDSLSVSDSYFTIVQFDRGVEHHRCPLNTLVFGCCEGDIPIPLVYETSAFDEIPRLAWTDKSIFCSFIGSITHEVRDRMIKVIQSLPDYYYLISSSENKKYIDTIVSSKFCLAPRGFGRSSFRFFEVLKLGSIPVYIWDDINWLPFQDIIDYSRLCVVIHVSELSELDHILKRISEEEYNSMLKYYSSIQYLFTFEGMSEQIFKEIGFAPA